ncbi:hypothetical protein O9992_15695 [Vibrio lentus]|nr:hypothetical protein [Vibrio lentus]
MNSRCLYYQAKLLILKLVRKMPSRKITEAGGFCWYWSSTALFKTLEKILMVMWFSHRVFADHQDFDKDELHALAKKGMNMIMTEKTLLNAKTMRKAGGIFQFCTV